MEARLRKVGVQAPGLGGHGLWLILAITLLLRIPFLNQPVQGDDDIYITEAAHAQIEPLHPANVKYVFRGRYGRSARTFSSAAECVAAGIIGSGLWPSERGSIPRRIHRVFADCSVVNVVAGYAIFTASGVGDTSLLCGPGLRG